ncbi:MAG: hypothetical protein HYR96_14590 [Deltaproteobacteria bacterium]|nr:hypothetical protein [Deltaproteobacteria bacterium]MBI3294619.1 hypothetical protein [Deltaproteobacteria bacterium]
MGCRLAFLGIVLCLLAEADCLTATPECLGILELGPKATVDYYRSRPLDGPDESVERAAILMHGMLSNADHYYEVLVQAALGLPTAPGLILIAPHFAAGPGPHLQWNDTSWKAGDDSDTPGVSSQFSSFDAMDSLLTHVLDRTHFPNLKQVVVAGHSAGGQFVSRYSSATALGTDRVRFVVGNPSSWLYLTQSRVVSEGFGVPSGCPDYDHYPYGLNLPNRYVKSRLDGIQKRFANRRVTVFLGELDTLDEDLDLSCEGMAQGRHRLFRGQNYYEVMKAFFSVPLLEMIIVPGVGHDGEKMFNSRQGVELLFSMQPSRS